MIALIHRVQKDTPAAGAVEQANPRYVAHVRIYAKLLETAGILKDRHLRCGFLFTADGSTPLD